jgi:hypothetical protein
VADEKRKRGRPPLPPSQRKPRVSGKHAPAPPDRLARVHALVSAVGIDVLAAIVGTSRGQIGPIVRGERSISEARLSEWEEKVRERVA